MLAVVDLVDDFVLVLDVLAGQRVVEVDACAAADDRADVALLAVDLDVRAGVAVVFVDLLGAYGLDIVGIVLAEGLLGGDRDTAGIAGLAAGDGRFDALEDVSFTEDDRPRFELLALVVDTFLLGDFRVGGVDELFALDGVSRVLDFDEIALLEPVFRVGIRTLAFGFLFSDVIGLLVSSAS